MATAQMPAASGMRRKAKRKLRALPTIVSLAALFGLAWWGWTKTHPAEDPNAKLITDTVSRGDLVETITATGSITAQTGAQVKIGSQITGVIKRLYADVGSYVKKGQIIAELDLPDIDAQLNQSQAALSQAITKLEQQQSGLNMQHTQTSSAVLQARAALRDSQAKLQSAIAASRLQNAQTPTDIRRAETALAATKAALSTAKSNLVQSLAAQRLNVATAREQLTQAKANAANSGANLRRQQELIKKGFVAASIVDTAQAQATVDTAQVSSAQQNVQLVSEKAAADVQSSRDLVTQAEQNVTAAQAALEAAQAGTFSDAAKRADVESARAQVRNAQASLTAALGNTAQDVLKEQDILQAREAVKQAQAQVDYEKAQLAKTFIRSPISGTVLQLASQQGETLAAGLSAPTLIIVADLKRLQVDVFVDETDIGKITLGQEAKITLDAFPKESFRGHVVKVASGSTIQSGVITYDVTVAIHDTKHQLKPDMTANVTIQTGRKTNVLLVPSEAVKAGTRGSTVMVLPKKAGPDVKPESRAIKTGSSDGVHTEITDGLKEGETVVLAGMDNGNRRQGASPFGPQSKKGGSGGGGGGGKKGG